MKIIKTICTIILSIVWTSTYAQNIPLFSQKLSNSFLYNPSNAGQKYGSATLSHSSQFRKVNGGARDLFLSAHKPLLDQQIGIGINAYSEKINFVNNVFISSAFAYHLKMYGGNMLSLGLSAEFNSMGFDRNEIIGEDNDALVQERLNRGDFSTGASYVTDNFELGVSVNRIASLMDLTERASLLSGYYSFQYLHKLRLDGGTHLIEPMINYQSVSTLSNIFNAGVFYTYNDLIVAGLSYQSTKALNISVGGYVTPKIMTGLSYQSQLGPYKNELGGSFEIVLRFDIDRKKEVIHKTHFKKTKTQKRNQKNNSSRR